MMADNGLRIGGLGPLSMPGIAWAGRELRDGMGLAVQQLNRSGGVLGRPLVLLFEDTHGRPEAGVAALEKLLHERVHAIVGEFHSAVADALVEPIQRSRVPFVCASATLDDITTRRLSYVFRLAPPQSYGWGVYADYLASEGFHHVVALQEDNAYWNSGSKVIEARLRSSGVRLSRLSAVSGQVDARTWIRKVQALQSESPSPDMLLLLTGYPEPLRSVVVEARTRGLLTSTCFLGDPAGRTVFPDWWETVGTDAVNVPFLSYAPSVPTSDGTQMATAFKQHYAREPTFVAMEGYDSVRVLARALEDAGGTESPNVCAALGRMELEGARGTIRFSTDHEGVVHQQWKWPPVCVAVRRHHRQAISDAEVLWDASAGRNARSWRALRG